MTETDQESLEDSAATGRQPLDRERSFDMNTTGINKPNPPASTRGYDQLLTTAQAAQAAADRAVSDLAALKRTMSEAPRVLQLRRDELARAQSALASAENDYVRAREQVSVKQAEAARLIEAAAGTQHALAQALLAQDAPIPPAALEVLAARRSAEIPAPQPRPYTPPPSPATLGPNRYTPVPAMHPADLHIEVVEYLRERDALCPSCGHSLRGIASAQCPGCKLQLSLKVLHSVRARPSAASTAIWIVRGLALFAFVLSAYLTMITFAGSSPFGCGGGSACETIMRSPWSKVAGIPVALFALPLFGAIFIVTFFQRVGLTDTLRKRSWALLTGLSVTAGLTGLWLIAAQLVVFKSLCPHCVLVHVAGIAIAAIVLKKAPLRQPEKLPEPATGRIVVPRPLAVMALVFALVTTVGFAGIHGGLAASKGPVDRNKILGIPDQPANPDSGLMMKGLEGVTPSKPEDRQPVPHDTNPGSFAAPPAPKPSAAITPTPAPEPAASDNEPPALLLPGLDPTPAR